MPAAPPARDALAQSHRRASPQPAVCWRQAAEHMDKRYESELLLLPSYCSWAMHVVPVLKPRLSCARQHRLLAAAFCKKALQLGAIGASQLGFSALQLSSTHQQRLGFQLSARATTSLFGLPTLR